MSQFGKGFTPAEGDGNSVDVCQACDDGLNIKFVCLDCCEGICCECEAAHRRVTVTRDHTIMRLKLRDSPIRSTTSTVDFSSLTSGLAGISLVGTESEQHCPTPLDTQPDSDLTIILVSNVMIELESLLKEVKQQILVLDTKINYSATEKIDAVHRMSDEAKREILDLMNEFRRLLSVREEELLCDLKVVTMTRYSNLNEEIEAYRSMLTKCKQAGEILAGAYDTGDSYAIFEAMVYYHREMSIVRELIESAVFPDQEITFVPPRNDELLMASHIGGCRIKTREFNEVQESKSAILKRSSDDSELKAPLDEGPSERQENTFASRPFPKKMGSEYVVKMGIPQLVFGKKGRGDGELNRPWGICCNTEGNIIVADRSNDRIQIFSQNGMFLFKFGTYGRGAGQFNTPADVAVGPEGKIFVTDKDNHRVQVFTRDGCFLFMFGRRGNAPGYFKYPWGIAINSMGIVVVSDSLNQRIQLFGPDGMFLHRYAFDYVLPLTDLPISPRGVCFDSKWNIIVTDFKNRRLVMASENLTKTLICGSHGSGAPKFLRPQGIAFGDGGILAVADSKSHSVQIIKEDGTYMCQIGSLGTDAGQFHQPGGICFTPEGRIVVADSENNRVQIF